MRVALAVLARYAETDEDGTQTIVGGGIELFGVRELPVEFDQPVALQFRFHETEAGHDVEIEVEVLGPSLTVVGEPTSFTITPQLAPYRPEGWEGMYAVTGTVVLYAEELGAHTVSIKIDGKVEGSIPFQIIQAPDEE